MPLVARLGYDTIMKLEAAADQRFREAEILVDKDEWTGAVYLFGYVAEMALGCAYLRFQEKYRKKDGEELEITLNERKVMLNQARLALDSAGEDQWAVFKRVWPKDTLKHLKRIEEPHPIYGLALLLHVIISRRGSSEDRKPLAKEIVDRASAIRLNWEPKLRYRADEPSKQEFEEVRAAAKWFLKNVHKMR